jgi:hypothetical protein
MRRGAGIAFLTGSELTFREDVARHASFSSALTLTAND